MIFSNQMSAFKSDECGAVTVDWVVLTAAIVGLGIAVLVLVSGGTTELAGDIIHRLEHHVYDMGHDHQLHQ